jgi:allantoicase
VDGRPNTRWSSEFSDPQWIAVDLGKPGQVSRVVLDWEAAFGKAYAIEVSLDGQAWKQVYQTVNGRGGSENITFAPVAARWIRLTGTQRGTQFGYSLWGLGVFRE